MDAPQYERTLSEVDSEMESVRTFLQSPTKFQVESDAKKFVEQTVQNMEENLLAQFQPSRNRKPVMLLEVYAGTNSPLTDAVLRLGFKAIRFTKQDGDLSTFSGRRKLWSMIEEFEPEHIWVSPECGPWGGWSFLNQQKSLAMFDDIMQKKVEQLPHAKLCEQLCRHQLKHDRHFHFEQPIGSRLLLLKIFEQIQQKTATARFDMCSFGLQIPNTNRFIKKRSQVLTTSRQMFHSLHQRFCADQHEHQRLEGSASINGVQRRLTSFSATYCRGFANAIARNICKLSHDFVGPDEIILAAADSEDDLEMQPPTEKARLTLKGFKRQKLEHPESSLPDIAPSASGANSKSTERSAADSGANPLDVSKPDSHETDQAKSWSEIMKLAKTYAPRVGNQRCPADSEMWRLIQEKLVKQCQISDIFVCRGTERFQVPLHAPSSHEYPLRYTICTHRQTGDIHDLGLENWHNATRAQRIRKSIPSHITLTIFGSAPMSDSAPAALPDKGIDMSDPAGSIEPSSAVRAKGNQDLPVAVHARTSNVACEGWAPPPVPLHGPCFRMLNAQEKQDLVKLHKNLGHPDPMVLAQHLKASGAADHVVDAAKEYICDACVESTKFSHQRPAKLHDPKDFNELVGIDGFYWTGKAGFQVMVFHCIDEASNFHLGRRLENRHLEHVVPAFTDMWFSWAGQPQCVYSDPAGEFRSADWYAFLQRQNIEPRFSAEAWQKGRVERHGQILKNMLSRYDQEKRIDTVLEFDAVLRSCFQAKNALARHQGYAPEQIVLGKSTRLPASLASDEQVASHSLADGSGLDSEKFRRTLEIRSRARKVFMLADNDASIRRALLRRSRPVRGPFSIGQSVMYWMRKTTPGRRESGRWHGPGRIVCQDGSTTVWVAYGDRLMRCAPENIRPASLREWNHDGTPLDGQIPNLPEISQNMYQENSAAIPEDETYSPSLAPDIPEPPMNQQTSGQPESELFPEIPSTNQSTPLMTSDIEPVTNPNPLEANLENDNAIIDLDEHNLLDDSALISDEVEEVFACHELDPMDPSCEIKEWNSFQSGEVCPQICLADDELPYLDSPLQPSEQQCFMLEVPLSKQDLLNWSRSEQPEEMIHVAAASKRARAEVQIKDLTITDRKLFDAAKQAELSCWLQTSALRPVLRKGLNPEQILKSRWVLTWKPVPEEDGLPNNRKAKARLVVLGFQDPRLTEVSRDAPTLTREGRNTILQMIASHHWTLTSFDIKTAFLRGKADSNNPLAMEPPKELRDRMQLQDEQVCALIGNAYGRVDAPLLFYKELTSQLKDLGFKMHPLEPCVHDLESWKDGKRTLHGVLGTHVDDGVGGGDKLFHDKLNILRKSLPFGSFKQRRFVFTGIQLEQLPDFSIRASQIDYVNAIPHIEVGMHRRNQPESPVNDTEMTSLRGLIGSLQYATTHTRPDMSAKLGEIQIQLSKPTVQTLLSANKVLREAQQINDVYINFRSIDPKQMTHVVFGDASFASPKQLASFQGTTVFATTPDLQANKKAPISPLTWSSKKISRVVRSTLSAEAFSMSRSVDKMGWCRLLWGAMVVDDFKWRDPPIAFQQLHPAIIVTDCKSLYDLVSRRAMPACEEYRTTLEVLLIKERCLEHCCFRWIPTVLQLADPLTKNMDSSLLRAALEQGHFQLFDEQASLQTNSHKKQALSWIQQPTFSEQKM